MAETGGIWPIIRAIGRALTIPGTQIGLSILTDIQDQLSEDEFRRKVNGALTELVGNTAAAVRRLSGEQIAVGEEQLREATLDLAETLYLDELAGDFYYADFKGIEQVERFVSLPLDEIFVGLKAARESRLADRDADERELAERLAGAGPAERRELERRLADRDADRARKLTRPSEAKGIDELLAAPGGLVLLGGPGTGKTTLVKRLARSCALGAEEFRGRYPAMPWCFPVVVPVTEFDERRDEKRLLAYIESALAERSGPALVAAFGRHWTHGRVLVLLDGLDEVADSSRRVECARRAEQLLRELGANRAMLTCRVVGYSLCRLSVPAIHAVLQPWQRGDIEAFARRWHEAYERAIHPEAPRTDEARRQAESLIEAIRTNPRVESLATNPLMLTIIALIKQRNVTLPQRRAQLYDVAINTLIGSWNKARSLSHVPVGEDLTPEETKRVWGYMACWMHEEVSRGTCHRSLLQRRLVEVLIEETECDSVAAEKTAASYIHAAAETSGLLEPRGADVFAFVHQTFQEYLAAWHLSIPHGRAAARAVARASDPRWHEVIRLTAGIIGIVRGDNDTAGEVVTALAAHEPDGLATITCAPLRLAAACIADDLRLKRAVVDDVIVRLCQRLDVLPYEPRVKALADALAGLPPAHGPAAVAALCAAAKHADWRIRMQAARLLGEAARRNDKAKTTLRTLFEKDRDDDVKAHAAMGLWRADLRRDAVVVRALCHGLTSSYTAMSSSPEGGLLEAVVDLLSNASSSVRLQAAEVLGGWGHQAEALDAVLGLLSHASSDVRLGAAEVLAGWGHQAQALDAVLGLLSDASSDVRLGAAEVLRGWGHQAEALDAVLGLLSNADSSARLRAAAVLGGWGHQAEALDAVLSLLSDADSPVRYRAAVVLGGWGPQAEALDAVLGLLSDADSSVRYRAAVVLGEWGGEGGAAGVVLSRLVEGDVGAAVAWLEAGAPAGGFAADGVGEVLARAIEPRDGDSYETRVLRDVVFQWVWNAGEGAD